MIPYADFTYLALIVCVAVPTVILAVFGRAGWRWACAVTVFLLVIQFYSKIPLRRTFEVRQIWIVILFGCWQWILQKCYGALSRREGVPFYTVIGAATLPLVLSKVLPLLDQANEFGFIGISYVTFRALDVLFCLRDRVIEPPGAFDFFNYLFFIPTISSGPIDRYRRFVNDWRKQRAWSEFLTDLDFAVHRLFQGLLYKFILAALIKQYWLDVAAAAPGVGAIISYMYAYSLYLFFDFAGYSAFAIAFSSTLGVHTPENFKLPFIARNIRDFWTRWHITLSFWFRDHVYMRFLLAARRGKWIANKHATAVVGYFLSFGLMGLWHGLEPHFIAYGLYHGLLLSGYHLISERRKNKTTSIESPVRRGVSILITFNLVCFGFLIFSGHLGA